MTIILSLRLNRKWKFQKLLSSKVLNHIITPLIEFNKTNQVY
jgi:hypothetical protein